MSDKPVFHVYTLKPLEQACLRILLKNYFKDLLDFEIRNMGADPNNTGIEYSEAKKKAKQITRMVDIFEYMTQLLASVGTLGRARPIFMTINKTSMKYVLKAIDLYEKNDKKLLDKNEDEEYVMTRAYESTKKTLKDSSNHEFTEDEIKRAKGK